MSYVKGMVVWKGKPHVFEVHGSDFLLNPRIDYDWKKSGAMRIKKIIPDKVKTAEDYVKYAHDHEIVVSGTKEDRFKEGLAELDTSKKKERFVRWLRSEHIKGYADSPPKGFKGNVIIDLDKNTVLDSKDEWYAEYLKYLYKGWKGKELRKKEFNKEWKKLGRVV